MKMKKHINRRRAKHIMALPNKVMNKQHIGMGKRRKSIGCGMKKHHKKGGWVAPIAASVLGSVAPLVWNKVFGDGRKKRGGLSHPYAGRIKKGSHQIPPGLAAYLAKKRANKTKKAGAIVNMGPTAGPLI